MALLFMSSRCPVNRAPPGAREVMGSIPVGDSDFSLSLSRLMPVDQFTFHNDIFDQCQVTINSFGNRCTQRRKKTFFSIVIYF